VRGQAIYRPGRYTAGGGQFTVGITRGLSGEATNRWGRNLKDYEILFTQEAPQTAHDMAEGEFGERHDLPDLVEWVLERVPAFGRTLTKIKKLGVFSWHAGDTVLSDIQYLELNSKVYVTAEAGRRLKFYVLEGNPVLHAGRGDARVDLQPGQVATCAPAQPARMEAFDPAQLERVWEHIRYISWDKADRAAPPAAEERVVPTESVEPLDLDLAARIMQGLERLQSEPATGIPSLQATVTGVKFYEAGYDGAPMERRTYGTRFPRSATRLIWWELNLAYPDPGRRIDFAVEAFYFRPDGTLLNRHVDHYFIQSPWTGTAHSAGFGGREPGTWSPGPYRVEFHVAGQKVAEGSFEVF